MIDRHEKNNQYEVADQKSPQLSIRQLFFGFTDLLFNLDSRLWQTLIGLVLHPIRTNQRYLAQGNADLLNPLKLLIGLSTLSVIIWSLLPAAPSFSELYEEFHPDQVELIRANLEQRDISWDHFAAAADQRMSMLNVPFILMTAIPLMFYFKLIRRDIPLVSHALFTLNCFNVYLVFNLLSAPLYFFALNLMLISGIPLFGVLVPYLLVGMWYFHARSNRGYIPAAAGMLVVAAISYVIASNIAVFVAGAWAGYSVR